MSAAEKFAMCMAEAGFPVITRPRVAARSGFTFGGVGKPLPRTEMVGRLVARAAALSAPEAFRPICPDCYAAAWVASRTRHPSHLRCEHVEATA